MQARQIRQGILSFGSWVLLLAVMTACSSPQPSITPTSPPTVTTNADWKPVIQTVNDVEMALVPPGCFMMGNESGRPDEKPVHQVCFEKAFWIDRYEVTNGQFARLRGQAATVSSWLDEDRPKTNIRWDEASTFCAKRSARLPTEAEWEFAARGPDSLPYPWGKSFSADNVVFNGNSGSRTAKVGSRPGGVSWVGAFDLSGNVTEWVSDWYAEAYESANRVTNPQGPTSGSKRVIKGGSWAYFQEFLQAPYRFGLAPETASLSDGFRCVRDY